MADADSPTLAEKQQQFSEYFMIAHSLNVNVKLLPDDFMMPSLAGMEASMPYAFRIASELSEVESKALRPLRGLADHAQELVDFLNHQSRKIDLIMSYILQQQDDEDARFTTVRFGGGGLVVDSATAIEIGSKAELKIFLTQEASAVYCLGEAIGCESVDERFHVSFIFNRIRELDQELLVRASLHLQTQQLRQRSKQDGGLNE
ncbi:PilZ domain-containing protein [Aestuariibacter salexigens]|uniref:PilZ domain-containing protein n=1 Tax=Aestuariibacter salexigens TaxID=226010 RepID=UPI0004138141|nr:PilZ domain-containing protein [Aestuariibacter salexigens]